MKTPSSMLMVAAILGALSVAMGAFGAHALKQSVSPEMMIVFKTAVDYQSFHTLALFFSGLLMLLRPQLPYLRVAGWLFVVGIGLFSVSLVALALGAPRWLGMVTPFGGLSFIAGWVMLVLAIRHIKI